MLLDNSGNTFFGLNRTIPTVTYNPKQIFGNDLYCWVDTTDYRTLYATRTGTTHISPIGSSVINRMEDLSENFIGSSHSITNNSRTFFPFSGNSNDTNNPNILPSSSTYNVWCGQTIDTNKGRFKPQTFFVHTGTSNNSRNQLGKANSAATLCSFLHMPANAAANGHFVGLVSNYFSVNTFGLVVQGSSPNLRLITVNSARTSNVIQNSVNIAQFFGNFMCLCTITGNSYYVYINNILMTSGTMTNYNYPLTITSTPLSSWIFFDSNIGLSPLDNQNGGVTYESFIVDNYTTPQQVSLVNNYFKVKYKDRRGL